MHISLHLTYLVDEALVLGQWGDGAPVVLQSFRSCGQQVGHQLVVYVHKPDNQREIYSQRTSSGVPLHVLIACRKLG